MLSLEYSSSMMAKFKNDRYIERALIEAKQLPQEYQSKNIKLDQPSSTLKSVANFDTLEKLQNDYKEKSETAKTDNGPMEQKLIELHTMNDGLSKNIIMISNKVNDIIKCLCSICSSSAEPTNNSSRNLCKLCNSIFCESCLKCNRCCKCHVNICCKHSIKCHLCESRVCNDGECRNEFSTCPSCDSSFCPEHYNIHKTFNQKENYHLKCTSSSYHVTQPFHLNSYIELANVCLLKELKICSHLIRLKRYKQRIHECAVRGIKETNYVGDIIHM